MERTYGADFKIGVVRGEGYYEVGKVEGVVGWYYGRSELLPYEKTYRIVKMQSRSSTQILCYE